MTEPAGLGVQTPRAFLRVGGITLARHQLGLALAMDCQRIVCLAHGISPDLIALQHDAEKGGAHFHIISGPRGLAGLVTANDDLLVLADGLLVEARDARALLDPGHIVLVQPVETGLAAGFERIDLNRASAGALRIPGRLVEGLMELPPDCDTVSAITRIALQADIPAGEVPPGAREGVRWRLIRDEDEAHAAETEWIRAHLAERRSRAPARWLARLGLLRLGPPLLHAGNGSRVTAAGALAVLLLAWVAGWFGYALAGFLLCGFAAILRESVVTLRDIERRSLGLPNKTFLRRDLLGGIIDLSFVLIVVWSEASPTWDILAARAFAPLMLMLLVRLASRLLDRGWSMWIDDRIVLALLLALAAGLGMLMAGTQLLAVVLALAALVFPGGRQRLTRA